MNDFINAINFNGMTLTENGALTNMSTGSELMDQFGKAGNYRDRNIDDVFFDQKAIWEEDADKALRFPFYLRMITRKVKVNDNITTEKVQIGQGVRDEAFKRLLWISTYHPDVFYKNIWVLPLVGSWKDLWTLLYYDKALGVNSLKKDIIFEVINHGLACSAHVELIKKFMPRIKSNGKCKTIWTQITNQLAKDFANYNKMSYEDYNHIKTSGTAHDFQKIICEKRYKDIIWDRIPGRALNLLVSGGFIKKHNLEKMFMDWILANPTAKFTGYVYELGKKVIDGIRSNAPMYKKIVWDRQFDELIRKAQDGGKIKSNVWCAIDTSGSMAEEVVKNITAYDICISLGVFFSTLNQGAFHNQVIMFSDESRAKELRGSFGDKIRQIVTSETAWGSTNFMSIVEEIARIRKNNPNIPLKDYPTTILVVSDMQFNPSSRCKSTNYEDAKNVLKEVFPHDWVDDLKFIWWDCTSRRTDFPATLNDNGCYFLSGFDGSIISMICGEDAKEKDESKSLSMEDIINKALNQEILNYIQLT